MASALFFDVDGTLIDSYHGSHRISSATLAELKRIQGLGHKVFLSSGRPRNLLTPELLEPGFDGLVLINGGYVEMDGVSVYEERMDTELARKAVAFAERLGLEYIIVAAHNTYTKRENQAFIDFFADVHGDIFTFDYSLEEVLPSAIKLEAMVDTADRARVTELALQELGPLISCDGHGGEGTFELYPTAISKAKGIEVVLDRLGIDVRDAYGFGDGTNDLEMIRYCGVGVAMGNAEDVVKDAADIVCPPVWDDGLAQILGELF